MISKRETKLWYLFFLLKVREGSLKSGMGKIQFCTKILIGLVSRGKRSFNPQSLAQSKGGEVCPCGPSQVTSVQSIMGVLTLKWWLVDCSEATVTDTQLSLQGSHTASQAETEIFPDIFIIFNSQNYFIEWYFPCRPKYRVKMIGRDWKQFWYSHTTSLTVWRWWTVSDLCQSVWGASCGPTMLWMVTVLSLSVSAEMLGYSYELDSPYTGVKNRAVPNVVVRSLVRPLQKMGRNIQVSFPVSFTCLKSNVGIQFRRTFMI